MNKIIDYDIVSGDFYQSSESFLCNVVKDKLKDGWVPLGAPFYHGGFALQALVKYEEDIAPLAAAMPIVKTFNHKGKK